MTPYEVHTSLIQWRCFDCRSLYSYYPIGWGNNHEKVKIYKKCALVYLNVLSRHSLAQNDKIRDISVTTADNPVEICMENTPLPLHQPVRYLECITPTHLRLTPLN